MTTPIDYKGRRHRFRWPVVRRSTAEDALRASRRNMIDHLRQNPRGLVLLDQARVDACTFNGPLICLGDYALVTATRFLLPPPGDVDFPMRFRGIELAGQPRIDISGNHFEDCQSDPCHPFRSCSTERS